MTWLSLIEECLLHRESRRAAVHAVDLREPRELDLRALGDGQIFSIPLDQGEDASFEKLFVALLVDCSPPRWTNGVVAREVGAAIQWDGNMQNVPHRPSPASQLINSFSLKNQELGQKGRQRFTQSLPGGRTVATSPMDPVTNRGVLIAVPTVASVPFLEFQDVRRDVLVGRTFVAGPIVCDSVVENIRQGNLHRPMLGLGTEPYWVRR